ncbi:MAG: polysaccharide pyruvyl transferase CsaB, partial [Bacillota bacterium]
MKVVISGYYGFDNAGDEAVLAAILAGLRRECPTVHPVVLSGNPARTAARHGVEAVPRLSLAAVRRALREADLFVSGGGTLLQDLTGWGSVPYYGGLMLLAHRLGVPGLAWAPGVVP